MKSVSTLTAATILVAMATSLHAGPRPPAVEPVWHALTVDLRDGSRLLGRASDIETLPLDTKIGKLDVRLAEVASCRVDVATVADGNVALASGGATVSGAGWPNAKRNRLALIDGETTDYDDYAVSKLPSSWVVTLPRTYLLSEIRLLLYDKGDLFYRYVVETSLDGKTYQTAADRSQGKWRSWQKLIFEPRPVRYIRVRGLYGSAAPYMDALELEAYCKPPREPRLVFWNTLDSEKDVRYSKVGPSGKIVGRGVSFVPGKVGKGFTSGHGKAGPNFGPWEKIHPEYHRAGTIEFWWKPARDYDEKSAPPDEIFISGKWQQPWNLPFQMLYRWRENKGCLGGFDFQVADQQRQQHYLCTGKVVPFKAGDWLHVAYMWDMDGLPNDRNVRYGVFVNGEYYKLTDGANPGGDINYTMGRPEGAYFSMGYYDADSNNQLQGVLDEVSIWDAARTDFRGDRLAIDRVAEAGAGRNGAPGKLLLWNKLGSKKEVHQSEVGPGGTYSGEGGRFVEGRFGEAFSATAEEIHYQLPPLVTFPKEVISTDAGCMEVWAKLDGFSKTLKSGENPALLKIHDGTCSYILHLNGNDGSSKGGLCGRAGGHSSAGTGAFGTWTYEQVLGKGQVEQWHHYALVWDKDGIPGVDDGTRKIALFLDGKLNSQMWRTGPNPWVNGLTGGELRLLLNHHLSRGSAALDNLKIWNYAKTDFSDRFVEGRGSAARRPPVPAVSPKDGLVLHYAFDEDEGGRVTDRSGMGHGVTLNGNLEWTDEGVLGGGLAMKKGDTIVVSEDPAAGLEALAVAMWFRPANDATAQDYAFMATMGDGHGRGGWRVKIRYPRLFDGSGQWIHGGRTDYPRPVFLGRHWYHVAMTYSGTGVGLYIDGKLAVNNVCRKRKVGTSGTLRIFPDGDFEGTIDEVRVYNRYLSQEDIKKLAAMKSGAVSGT